MVDLTTVGAIGPMPDSDHPVIANYGRAIDLPLDMSHEQMVQEIIMLKLEVARLCVAIDILAKKEGKSDYGG